MKGVIKGAVRVRASFSSGLKRATKKAAEAAASKKDKLKQKYG
jgi:hypothetical protein